MNIRNITVVVEPEPPGKSFSIILDGKPLPNLKSIHDDAHYTELVNTLKELTKAKVRLVIDGLQAAPASGIVMLYPQGWGINLEQTLCACTPKLEERLAQRLVLLNSLRGETRELTQKHHFAAAVDMLSYDEWWVRGQVGRTQVIYGLATVAEEIGAHYWFDECNPYCHILANESEGLPEFLLRYLEAYVKIIPGISELDL
jgi:hypothetical protein